MNNKKDLSALFILIIVGVLFFYLAPEKGRVVYSTYKFYRNATEYSNKQLVQKNISSSVQIDNKNNAKGDYSGRVLYNSKGVSGVAIYITGTGIWPPLKSNSVDDGYFYFSKIPDGIYEVWAVETKEGLASQPSIGIELSKKNKNIGNLYLEKAGKIIGNVVDEEGNKIEDAELNLRAGIVSSYEMKTKTSTDSSFIFFPVAPGNYYVFSSSKGFMPYKSESLIIQPDKVYQVNIKLKRGFSLSGTVFNMEKQPVSKAAVYFTSENDTTESQVPANGSSDNLGVYPLEMLEGRQINIQGSGSCFTNENGDFVLTGLSTTEGLINISHPDYCELKTKTKTNKEYIIYPGAALKIRVSDVNDYPLENVKINLTKNSDDNTAYSLLSDSRGEVETPHLCGRYILTAMYPDYIPYEKNLSYSRTSGEMDSLEIKLLKGESSICAGLFNKNETPIADADVVAQWISGSRTKSSNSFSDENGQFCIYNQDVNPPVRITLNQYGSFSWDYWIEQMGNENKIYIPQQAKLLIKVSDIFSGELLDGVKINIYYPGVITNGVMTNNYGEAEPEIPYLDGELLIRASFDGYVSYQKLIPIKNIISVSTYSGSINIQMEPGYKISGYVKDEWGQPIEGAVVSGEDEIFSLITLDKGYPAGVTDSEGNFVIEGIGEKTSQIIAFHPCYGQTEIPVTLMPNRDYSDFEIVLRGSRQDNCSIKKVFSPGLVLASKGSFVEVKKIVQGTPACSSSIVEGDILYSVGDKRIVSVEQGYRLLNTGQRGTIVAVLKRRNQFYYTFIDRQLMIFNY